MEYWDLYDAERKPLGRTHARGTAFEDGEYYVCCEVWVMNSDGAFLTTKRHPALKAGNQWEFVGGGTAAGETTKQSAVRELLEETAIQADESELTFLATYQKKNYFLDIYILHRDVALKDIVLQEEEAVDVKWATDDEIRQMIANGEFAHSVGKRYELFAEKIAKV